MIRTLAGRDVDAILAIQNACPEIAQWTSWDYHRAASGEMAGWVAEKNARIVGFLVARRLVSDLEILNLAVTEDARRQGIGAALLNQALAWARIFQATHAILEVRESNLAALRFYESHKFKVVGRRARYYTAPIEDALLLTAALEFRDRSFSY
ncbi:MAG: ribosomal protein S18-alanine N-acetyltransferase [Candidatus Acidiferrales bacterium]